MKSWLKQTALLLLLFSEMHLFCMWKLTCSVRLVLMQHVDNSSKKSWRATVLQEDIWARRLKAIREDEAEEWGDHKGVVTLLTSLSDAGNLSWMRPNCSQDWLKLEQLLREGSKGSLSNCQFYDEVLYWTRALCALNHWKYTFLLTRQHLRHDSVRAVWPLGCRVIYSPTS